jgi:alkylation response protein AidB-like acyl-CoA dehydrogenase
MTQPRDFGFDDETAMLKDAATRFFAGQWSLARLRAELEGSEDPYRGRPPVAFHDASMWQQMVALGWPALAVPEQSGGVGLGLVAAAAIQEEVGRAACPTPLTSTLQATFVLREAQAAELLSRVVEGMSMGLAVFGEDGSLGVDSTDVIADGARLTGTSWYVQDAQKVDGFLVAAKSPGGIGLYHVERSAVEVVPDRIVDLTRDQARVVLDGTEARPVSPPGEGARVLERALPAIWTLLAADIAGAAEWQLQATADYARVRVQFDRPIGFFQAVKHPIVNMMIAVDETRSLVYNAACAYDHEPDEARRCALLAKSSASDTASFCANRSTQLHGGIGFTWESDVQVYHKRQMHSQFLHGDGAWHRQQLAALL